MAIFACTKCGYTLEKLVATVQRRQILTRTDHCCKCDKARRFYFLAASGMVGKYPHRPEGWPAPQKSVMWWRKTREGRKASAPLDAVCKKYEY